MKDFFLFGGGVLAALLFAAAQLGHLHAPQGGNVARAPTTTSMPGQGAQSRAVGIGAVQDAALTRPKDDGPQTVALPNPAAPPT